MSPDIFLEGQFFTVTIEDATLDSDKAIKSDAEVYSRITAFHSVDRPSIMNLSIRDHESGITQSTNQVINQSRLPSVPPQPGGGKRQPKSKPEGRRFRLPLRPKLTINHFNDIKGKN
jgi:hypothetical protein